MTANRHLLTVHTRDWRRAEKIEVSEATQVGEYSIDYEQGLKPNSKEQFRGYVEPSLGCNLYYGSENEIPYKKGGARIELWKIRMR